MYENAFMDMFDPSIIEEFRQSAAPLPYQNLNFLPPTPPQQMHLYPKDNVDHINNTCLIEDSDNSSYDIEPTDCNMNYKQTLSPFSLQMNHKNILLTPSPSTETCSPSVMNSTRDLFQDFSLYPANCTPHNNNPVDQGITLTTNNSAYSCSDFFLQVSPRSSSPQTHNAHQFYTNTSSNTKGKVASLTKKKHLCKICNKSFGRPQELQRHQACHTGERNFTCSNCTKSFARRDAMRRHYKSHFKDKTKGTTRVCKVSH